MHLSEATLQKMEKVAKVVGPASQKIAALLLPPVLAGKAYLLAHDGIINLESSFFIDFTPVLVAGAGMIAFGLPSLIKDVIEKKEKISGRTIALALSGALGSALLIPELAYILKDISPEVLGMIGFVIGTLARGSFEFKHRSDGTASIKKRIFRSLAIGAVGAFVGSNSIDQVNEAGNAVNIWFENQPLAVDLQNTASIVGGAAAALGSGFVGLLGSSLIWPTKKSRLYNCRNNFFCINFLIPQTPLDTIVDLVYIYTKYEIV